jgi:hypothetical protein
MYRIELILHLLACWRWTAVFIRLPCSQNDWINSSLNYCLTCWIEYDIWFIHAGCTYVLIIINNIEPSSGHWYIQWKRSDSNFYKVNTLSDPYYLSRIHSYLWKIIWVGGSNKFDSQNLNNYFRKFGNIFWIY